MSTTDVAIVGAGPAGLTAACALRRAGVAVRIFDRGEHGVTTSRAAVIHARTLEVLQTLSVTSRLVEEGLIVPTFTVRDHERLLARLDFSGLDTAHPYTLMLPQVRTEQILLERLRELGGEVEWEREVSALDQSGASPVLEVRSRGHASSEHLAARFVIGADGMHSGMRSAAGIDFVGESYDPQFVLADLRLDWSLGDHEVQLFLDQDGLVVVAPLPGGRHRVVATTDRAAGRPDRAMMEQLLRDRTDLDPKVEDVIWSSRFTVQHRIASTFRSDALFLVGDAAHVHSPAGGQGMNTGIQDSIELANLLTDVMLGHHESVDLDDYERTRRPVARRVVSMTDRMTRAATLRGPLARGARNQAITTILRSDRVRHRLTSRIAELT